MKNKEESLISVIIPVYKVEKYLKRCVDSVIAQTYENIEIILVDDGSPDNCGEMCDEYAKADSRVLVIHKENGGLSSARNTGVEHSCGEWIAFVDSDDYISSDYIECLYQAVKEYNADISICRYVITHGDDAEFSRSCGETVEVLSGYEACLKLCNFKPTKCAFVEAYAKLIKRGIAASFPFPVGRVREDEAVAHKMLYEANKVVISDSVMYAYYQRPDSIMHSKDPLRERDRFLAFAERAEFLGQIGEAKLARIWFNYTVRNAAKLSVRYNGVLDELIFDISKRNRTNKHFPMRSRIYVLIYKISPKLFMKLKKYI